MRPTRAAAEAREVRQRQPVDVNQYNHQPPPPHPPPPPSETAPMTQGVPPALRGWVWWHTSGAAQCRARHEPGHFEAMMILGEQRPCVRQIELVRFFLWVGSVARWRWWPAALLYSTGQRGGSAQPTPSLACTPYTFSMRTHTLNPPSSPFNKPTPHPTGPPPHLPPQRLDLLLRGPQGAAQRARRVLRAQHRRGLLPGHELPGGAAAAGGGEGPGAVLLVGGGGWQEGG